MVLLNSIDLVKEAFVQKGVLVSERSKSFTSE